MDVYGTLWDKVMRSFFDGVSCLIPAMNPSVEMDLFHVIGRILFHGYLAIGFLPVRVSFTSLCTMLWRNEVVVPLIPSRLICQLCEQQRSSYTSDSTLFTVAF